MGQLDWIKYTSGAGSIADSMQDNSIVPDDQLAQDAYCRRFDGDRGHFYMQYDNLVSVLSQDISIRAALSIKKTDALTHMVGIGVRLSNIVFTTPASEDIIDRFATIGYQLILADDYTLKLYRISPSQSVQLFGIQLVGSVGQFKWFHLRLDFLLQLDKRAVLQVFQNDLSSDPITLPNWQKISSNIVENRALIPQVDKVGFGGLIDSSESTYVDRVEIYRS